MRAAGLARRAGSWLRRHPLEAAAGAAWAALVCAFAVRTWGFAIDDFFITYRYSWNLLAGHGFVFNPGERVFGTTAPGVGLLVALVAAVGRLPVPEAGTVVTAAALWSLAWALLRDAAAVARRGGPDRRIEAVAAGTFAAGAVFVWVHAGGEAPVVLALAAVAARIAGRRPALAGALAGLAVWCRPDAGLAVGILGLLLWTERRRLPWAYGLTAGGTLATGLAAARWWFGRFLPQTLEAKRLQAEWMPDIWAGGAAFWGESLRQLQALFFGPQVMVFVILGLVGTGLLVRSREAGRATRLLALYALCLLVAYPLLGVAYYGWYAIPLVIVLGYGNAFLAGSLARGATRFFGGRAAGRLAAAGLVATLFLPLAWSQTVGSAGMLGGAGASPRYDLYRHVGLWLRDHAAPDEAAAYVEVGTLAYFSRRPVHDLLGLVSPKALPWVARHDLVGAFLADPSPWLIYSTPLHGFIEPIRSQPWFPAAYREAVRFRNPKSGDELILYRRLPGAALPPPG